MRPGPRAEVPRADWHLRDLLPSPGLLLAGAGSGGASACFTAPLDVIKTRLQVQQHHPTKRPRYRGIFGTGRVIVREEGIRALYHGLSPNLVALVPTWSIYFSIYEGMKRWLAHSGPAQGHTHLQHMLSAVVGGFCTILVTNPLWVVRTRMITQEHGYTGIVHGVRHLWVSEGLRGLSRGFSASLFGLAHVGLQFPLYEQIKTTSATHLGVAVGDLPAGHIVLAACISKVVASSATYPHEVLRSRHQNTKSSKWELVKQTRRIYQREGIHAFYRGMGTNLMRVVPSCAITFYSFEALNRVLD